MCVENYRETFMMDSLPKMSLIPLCDHPLRQLIVTYSSYNFVFQEET